MPKTQLTDITIRSLNAPDKGQITYWDDKLSGFGCRVSQGGQKTFVVMYGAREARRRKVVGKYPIVTLKSARDEAKKVMASLALGVLEEKPIKAISFTDAREQFLEMSRGRNKPRTAKDYERLLNRHFKFKGKKLFEVTRADLQKSLAKLIRTPSEHHHAYVAIRVFFNWAYREELIETNPADRLQKPKSLPSRERVLDDKELAEIFNTAQSHEYPFGAIVMLCVLTGLRRGEVAMLQWDWIDETAQTITLPAEQVKNGRTHTFPYGELTKQLLEQLPRFDQYLFSGNTEKNAYFNGWGKSKKRFDEKLQDVAHYTLHDLRRTFSTLHAKIGTPIHVTEKLLNHVSGTLNGVAGIYNRHTYLDEMREAINQYDQHLLEICSSVSLNEH